jgi:hypothetical protein
MRRMEPGFLVSTTHIRYLPRVLGLRSLRNSPTTGIAQRLTPDGLTNFRTPRNWLRHPFFPQFSRRTENQFNGEDYANGELVFSITYIFYGRSNRTTPLASTNFFPDKSNYRLTGCAAKHAAPAAGAWVPACRAPTPHIRQKKADVGHLSFFPSEQFID